MSPSAFPTESSQSPASTGTDLAEHLHGDLPSTELRRQLHLAADWVADYLAGVERRPVLSRARPGDVAGALPASAPAAGEPIEAILADVERVLLPGTTHWNHPGFHGYFASTGSGPSLVGELLTAAINANAMLWRTGPAATELERVVLAWLRELLGLPAGFHGVLHDGASASTLVALAAARDRDAGLRVREDGLAGRGDLPRLRVYCSDDAHSSVDRAAMVLGLGRAGVRRVAVDQERRMDPAALAAAVADDQRTGVRPLAVVATVGSTVTTAVDPVPAIADLCARHGLWLHVDAAYGGAAAVLPELRHVLDGCDRADSFVVNPHKWLFVGMGCSALYTRHPDAVHRALSLVPDYLAVPPDEAEVNLMDYGIALGRPDRALRLWFVLRSFGADGIVARLREHIRLARLFAALVDDDPEFERLAPVPFSLVLFRHVPRAEAGGTADLEAREKELEAHNRRLLDRVNASGQAFLSHTRVGERFALRLAIGNLRTTERHVRAVWELLRAFASE